MTNEEFQQVILQELKAINNRIGGLENRIDGLDNRIGGLENRIDGLENRIDGLDNRIGGLENRIDGLDNRIDGLENELKEGQKRIEARQDDIYQVLRAIEHSNQVGRSELDSQNIRVAKLEGKFRKVAKAYNEDVEIDKAINL